jgi:hypothetical protein
MLDNGPIKRDVLRSAEFRKNVVGIKLRQNECHFRTLTAAALCEIATEHHSSIGLLLNFKRFASAQALLRPCIESSVRTVWILRCATQDQVDDVQLGRGKNKGWAALEQLIGQIEGTHKAGGFIRKLLPATSLLNDLTHSGMFQVAGRIGPVAKKFTPEMSGVDLEQATAAFCIRTADRALCLGLAVIHQDLGDPAQSDEMMRLYAETVDSYEAGRPPKSSRDNR